MRTCRTCANRTRCGFYEAGETCQHYEGEEHEKEDAFELAVRYINLLNGAYDSNSKDYIPLHHTDGEPEGIQEQ